MIDDGSNAYALEPSLIKQTGILFARVIAVSVHMMPQFRSDLGRFSTQRANTLRHYLTTEDL